MTFHTASPVMARSHHTLPGFIPDRGPAEYFHGRKRILGNFEELLEHAKKAKEGTTFLIQGALGVGKTALLDQCAKRAKGVGWKIAEIDPPALSDPDELLHCLGKGNGLEVTGGSGQVGLNAGIKARARLDVAIKRLSHLMVNILQDGKKPLLLILDEAHSLGIKDVVPSSHKGVVNSVLNNIHNGRLKRPVVLLAAGLGVTKTAFGLLGISRFKGGCYVELGALGKESERAVIMDWLKKRGKAIGDPMEWIDPIAQETHGWPHHILSYVYPASEQLKTNGGVMTPDGLRIVLRAGLEGRKVYYKERVGGFYLDELQCLANFIPDEPSGPPASRLDILSSLKKTYDDSSKAGRLFDRFLEKGLLEENGGGYAIPIPSMHTWLKDEYAREKIEIPRETQKSRSSD